MNTAKRRPMPLLGKFCGSSKNGLLLSFLRMIYIYYFWYNIAWSGMLVGYTVEILPYNIRAKGLTVMFLMVDIALFFNQM